MAKYETNLPRDRFREAIKALPGILSGTRPDPLGIGLAMRLRMATAFLEKVRLAFLVKSRGGVGEDGISWPPLSREYLAYGRGPFSSRRAGRYAPGTVRGGPRDGQQKDGFMTKKQLAEWRRVYGITLARLVLQMPPDEARGLAAAVAWNDAKSQGVDTKLRVFGNRQVDILRDRGELFNSLAPGVVVPSGASASYDAPEGQVILQSPGAMRVGTNVAHAKYHHKPLKPGRPARRLWPDELPGPWRDYVIMHGIRGLRVALIMMLGGRG